MNSISIITGHEHNTASSSLPWHEGERGWAQRDIKYVGDCRDMAMRKEDMDGEQKRKRACSDTVVSQGEV